MTDNMCVGKKCEEKRRMIIRKIQYAILWKIHFGLGRRYKINMDKTPRYNRIAKILESNMKIEPQDVTNVNLNLEEKELIINMCEVANAHIYENKISSILISRVKELIESNNIGFELLEIIEDLAICSGLYQFAYEVRELAEEKLVEKYSKRKKISSYDVVPVFWTYINRNDYNSALRVQERCSIFYRMFFKKELDFLMKLINNESCGELVKKQREEDLTFEKIVKEKKILVVGPTNGKEDVKKYLDKSDVIISMTYRNNLMIDKKNHKHISYYNIMNVNLLGEDVLEKYVKDLDMAVFKAIRFPVQEKLISQKKARMSLGGATTFRNKKEGIYFNFLYFYKSEGNLLQKILLDIILFEPKEITVTNVNLFLAKKRYNDKYLISGVKRDLNSDRIAFVQHNLINMYLMTKLLYDRNVIKVDAELKEVLELGVKRYMQAIEEIGL